MHLGVSLAISRPPLRAYSVLRDAAVDAARRNNAALWFAGAPSDLAGFVYQDSTGRTAATGTDPIGLMLDRSYGTGNLGPERVTNGDFSNGSTGWSASGTGAIISVSSGQMTVTNGAAVEAGAIPTGSVEIGKTYFVSCRRVSGTAPGFVVLGSQNLPISGAAGIKSGVVGPITGSTGIRVATGNATLNDAITFDDLSIREIFGYPALQATAANKPTLLINAAGYYDASFDATNDTWSVALPSSGTPAVVSYTETGAITGYVSATTSGFVIGNPTIGGKKLSLLVASASALPAGDLDIIKAFAGVIRGSAF